ncbi:MAG: bifunctional 5,10-methylenetetrahydrofolate dehydrogenase/5,10-methenyltetrahydrofolate cyclohydrolase [Chloroflexi bacterium]|uniref:Bifunctional protein FolD n=1 Tax=Candidatus Chlorohelix allophototropha TaxID=3003348 RepID=A0A8T7LVL6_9CHLR|nr:bifunctional 5,10-methylenetetrahydrofolate dehydrogenase/5,10-methenyltetrahydrofolate cyclohydrolase [Chloroflexota bacterium]WJW67918.1 bifunctional 5,10-methylenetetrahydrofolate dehydrogenase/5,10-methenyltetrahydrofolate cyclohydrolase [Chloroflexota bacterium L227-S17]
MSFTTQSGQAVMMDGKALAKEERERLKAEVATFTEKHGFAPGLAVVLVGNDPASIDYSGVLVRHAREYGMHALHHVLPSGISFEQFTEEIAGLNADKSIHGISIQWPVPGIDQSHATLTLEPRKDVEGYHPISTGKLFSGSDTFIPATPLGGLRLLEHYGYKLYGKLCLVVGFGVTVGRPLTALLIAAGATPVVTHLPTPRETLVKLGREADFIFGAAGAAHLITGEMVKPGAVVVDFGMSFIDGKMYGDVEVESVRQVAQAVTTSPSVSGRLTSIALLENVLKAARQQTEQL